MHILPLDRLRMELGIMLTTLPKPTRRRVGMDRRYEAEILDHLMKLHSVRDREAR